MPRFSPMISRTFSEYILIPGKTTKETRIADISLRSRLTDRIEMPLPFLSSAMQSVTGDRLAISLALHGGLGVLPCGNVSIEQQVQYVRNVKRFKSGFAFEMYAVSPEDRIVKVLELEKQFGFSTFPVCENGRLTGLITEKRYHPIEDLEKKVSERMIPFDKLIVGKEGISLNEANDMMIKAGIGVLPIIDKNRKLVSAVFYEDVKKHMMYPDAFVDPETKKLRVAAAVSTHLEDLERARQVVKNGADFLLIDSSDLFSQFAEDAIEQFKKLKVPIIAGNIVDSEGFLFLANLGVDCIKVGQGSGSICTTRIVKATGRGQATAVMDCAKARDEFFKNTGRYIPICSDGGISGTGEMAIGFALGADLLMMGKYFAGFTESTTPLIQRKFNVQTQKNNETREILVHVKEYWGEASAKAKSFMRYGHSDPRTFIVEGEEGWVLHKGSLHEQLPRDILTLKGTISACGCRGLQDFYKNAKVELQTGEAYKEGGTNIL